MNQGKNKERQNQFEKEITRYVSENAVTIINNVATCGKMPIYLAQAGYKVIVTGSKKVLDVYGRFVETSKEFDKNSLSFSNYYNHFYNDYKIIYITYGAELIEKILNNKDESTVLIIEDSFNSFNANLLFSFSKKLISEGAQLRLVIINHLTKYNNNISKFFDNAPIIISPAKAHHVSFIQKSAKDIENLIVDQLRYSSYKNFLVLLHDKNAIKSLSNRLNKSFAKYGINTKILELYSDLSFKVQHDRISKFYNSRVILSTDLLQSGYIPFDIDVVIDDGLQKALVDIDGVPTYAIRNISKSDIKQRQALAGMYYYLCSNSYDDRKEVYMEIDSNFDNMLLAIINSDIDIKSLKILNQKSKYYICRSLKLLQMLGAVDANAKITDIGKEMNKIYMEVRFSRILVEAKTYGVEFDSLICCLILSFGRIDESASEIAYNLKSDLFGQMTIFKQLYLEDVSSSTKQIGSNQLKKSIGLIRKISHMLKIKPSADTDIVSVKKCLACGFPDLLFIYEKKLGYRNNIDAPFRHLFTDSALYNKKERYVVGIPVNYVNHSDNSLYGRIQFPSAYTLEEVIECYSKWFTTGFYKSQNSIFETKVYNGIVIASRFIGSIEELKKSNPAAFHEKEEIDEKSGQTFISLYFHDLKVNSRPIIKIV